MTKTITGTIYYKCSQKTVNNFSQIIIWG